MKKLVLIVSMFSILAGTTSALACNNPSTALKAKTASSIENYVSGALGNSSVKATPPAKGRKTST